MTKPTKRKPFIDWITKHNIHIFDIQLVRISGIVTVPLVYLIFRLTQSKFSPKVEYLILFVALILLNIALTQLAGTWIGKKPSGSNWRNY